jgi:hypothetical protein
MKNIITLTVNPAIDKSTTVEGIKPHSKLRCTAPFFEAGGGGINVSRVIGELGGSSLCTYLAGGPTGIHLKEMLSQANILQQIIPIQDWTRENLAVTDITNNQQSVWDAGADGFGGRVEIYLIPFRGHSARGVYFGCQRKPVARDAGRFLFASSPHR